MHKKCISLLSIHHQRGTFVTPITLTHHNHPKSIVYIRGTLLVLYFHSVSFEKCIRSDQIRSVAQSCPTLCDPTNRSTPGLPVHHQLPEFTQTHVHRVSDAIQPSHPLSSRSPLAPNPSQHQSLFQWVNSQWHVNIIIGSYRVISLP